MFPEVLILLFCAEVKAEIKIAARNCILNKFIFICILIGLILDVINSQWKQ